MFTFVKKGCEYRYFKHYIASNNSALPDEHANLKREFWPNRDRGLHVALTYTSETTKNGWQRTRMICKPFKCIFVHIPKAAGRSVEKYFMDRLNLDRENAAHRRQLLLVNNDDPALGTQRLSHLSAMEYVRCGHLTQAEFDAFYKFSFVRNPWSRLVSEYRYRAYFSDRNFKDFVFNKLPKPGWDDRYRHVMPQSQMLCSDDGQLLVDFVGKFERLAKDFEQVCAALGFDNTALPHSNPSNKKSRELRRNFKNLIYRNKESGLHRYVDFYDDETREFVAELYRSDIEMFDYSFADALSSPP